MLTGCSENTNKNCKDDDKSKSLLPEQRGVFVGENDGYAASVIAAVNEYTFIRFEFVSSKEELFEKLYTYEPTLILSVLTDDALDILVRAAEIKRYHRCVTVGIAPLTCPEVRALKERGIITEFVIKTDDIEHVAAAVMGALSENLFFSENIRALADTMPIVTDTMWHDVSWDEKRRRSSISEKLKRLGVRKELAGHRYLIAAIALQSCVKDAPEPKKLYERIADYYDTTPLAVEKAIRYAIETAWMRGDLDYQHSCFGLTVDEDRGKPTNAEFIARLALDY